MEPIAIRWISLAFVLALAALAVWSFADASRSSPRAREGEAPDQLLTLAVHRPGQPVEFVHLENEAVLGRSRSSHIIFDDATVSKEHARLHRDGRSVFIEDLHSTNGTLVNGKAIEGPTLLRPGDRIALGRNVIVFASRS